MTDGRPLRVVPAELMETIERCLQSAEKGRPEGLETFSTGAFVQRTQQIMNNMMVIR